ncbi:MAG: DUF853 family protein, partial [Clostridia bacterium]|nr:DUF853 family protein [Clostridia bacterium]
CFLSSLPVLSVEPDIERKARRNILTDSLAASFPFSSFEVYDEGGIFLGLNKYNRSVAILDIFDSDKYANANGCIFGTTGAGKTFLLQNMALRFRMQGTQVFIIAPVKGHEYIDACEAIGGNISKLHHRQRIVSTLWRYEKLLFRQIMRLKRTPEMTPSWQKRCKVL